MNTPEKFRDLIHRDITVNACWQHYRNGHCTLEEAMQAMVVLLHQRAQGAEKQALDAMLCERVVYIKDVTK
jgi:hypothetical protein